MNKKAFLFVLLVLTSSFFAIGVCASESGFSEKYNSFIDSLPSEIVDKIPENFFSDDSEKMADAVMQMSGIRYIFGEVMYAFGFALKERIPSFIMVFVIVIFSSIANQISSGMPLSKAFGMCSKAATIAIAIKGASSSFENMSRYFESLSRLSSSFIPLSGVLYAMGGNVTSASASTATLSVALSVCEFISSYTIMPFFCICFALILFSSFDAGLDADTMLSSIKKNYMMILGLIMTVISGSIAAQTVISSHVDGAAMKGIKYAAGSLIPVTGGTVSQGLGTLAAGISLLRSTVGIGGIIIIFIMLLPTIFDLLTIKIMYDILAFIAGICGCSSEKKLLSEMGSLYGLLEGVAILCSFSIVISMAVLAFCTCAVA